MKQSTSFLRNSRASRSKGTRGKLLAEVLTGAWRAAPDGLAISTQELDEIAPLLLKSGAGGLAWCKVRRSEQANSAVGRHLHQAYRLQSLQGALHERSLKNAISLLRSVGAEPIVVKGWSIARIYPEIAMRPYCDLDLCVLPDHHAKASEALKAIEGLGTNVDLHSGFGKFYDDRTDDIFARSRLVKLDDIDVRVLCEEDNIRYLCMHLLRHGAVSPLWLCDIGVALESRTSEFDWDRCLAGSRREADWVVCAIALASLLLGVDIERTPVSHRAHKLPSWLTKAVWSDWGIPFRSPRQVQVILRQPLKLFGELPKELLRHWPNPIEATMTLRGPLNRLPRLPFQVGHVISRTIALASELILTSRALHHRS
jgi:putative nucleotidyltransferase-like protein